MALDAHHRLSVSALSSWNWTLEEDLAFWAESGIDHVGIWTAKLQSAGWDQAVDQVAAAGLRVGNVIGAGPFLLDAPSTWAEPRRTLDAMMTAAEVLGPGLLAMTTGPAWTLDWDQAVAALGEAIAPVRAAHPEVTLAFEHTHLLRADLGFVGRLADAIDLARTLGVGVLAECNVCWAERDVYRTIAEGADVIALVQVDDFLVGTCDTPNRVVPGEGDIPLERLVRAFLDAGYTGTFDLEIAGPRIEAEGYASAITRSVVWMSDLLDRLGA